MAMTAARGRRDCRSGTLAQIIPPSLVLIIIADQLGRSVGDMYKAPSSPGLMLTGFYALYAGHLAGRSSNPSGCLHCRQPVRCAKTTARAVFHRCWC